MNSEDRLARMMVPLAFVFLWSTGFVGAKYGLPYAEPFTFLAWRMLFTVVLLGGAIVLLRQAWPASPKQAFHASVTGVLIHCFYLGGIFSAIEIGMPAGLAALIAGLQPILTAVMAQPLLGETVTWRQWTGLLLGFGGIAMVLGEKMLASQATDLFGSFGIAALVFALAAVVGMTLGTIYQKRFGAGIPMASGAFFQYIAACIVFTLAAFAFETGEVSWTGEFILAMGWLVIALSVGAILLLMKLIEKGDASRVASLLYLVPPCTALQAWVLFGETMGVVALAGIAVASAGVALSLRK